MHWRKLAGEADLNPAILSIAPFGVSLSLAMSGIIQQRKLVSKPSHKSVTLSMSPFAIALSLTAIGLLTGLNGYAMAAWTDASFPFADAWTTWMSVFAQILMIRKYWQSWAFWVVTDVGAIYIYFAKGLYVVSGLYVLFLLIASFGLVKWYRDYKMQTRELAQANV
jgi:nicotinamide mononucleotide transporter PnuC